MSPWTTRVAYDTVTIDYPVDLRLVAECVDATPAQLQDLNPSLLRLTTPREGTFELHLPAGTKDQYHTAIAAIPPDMRLWWRYHKVQPGDTLASLSRTYRVPAKSIAAANHLDEDRDVKTRSRRQVGHPARARQASRSAIPPPTRAALPATRFTRETPSKPSPKTSASPPQMVRRWNGLPRGYSLRGQESASPAPAGYAQHAKPSPTKPAARRPKNHSNRQREASR